MSGKPLFALTDELIDQWWEQSQSNDCGGAYDERVAFLKAVEWGANQELQECIDWVSFYVNAKSSRELYAARRPSSLKQQALMALEEEAFGLQDANLLVLRQAINAIPDNNE